MRQVMQRTSVLRVVAGGAMAAFVVCCAPAVAAPVTAATGYIDPVNGARIDSGDNFTLQDGAHAPVTFELRSSGTVTPGRTLISVNVGDTAATVRSKIITAVNNIGADLNITASDVAPGIVRLVNDN